MPYQPPTDEQLPALPQGWPAKFRCDSCDGNGEVGEPMYMGHFQPPERARCPDCDGSGCRVEESGYSASDMRTYGLAAYEAGKAEGWNDCMAIFADHMKRINEVLASGPARKEPTC